jgi:multiple RNA-binding domain-containing protein 1
MGPASKSKFSAEGIPDVDSEEPPMKMQAIELPEAESDDEYETVPKKARKVEAAPKVAAPTDLPVTQPEPQVQDVTMDDAAPVVPVADAGDAADDDDWLRSRTSRLLDIMDPDELAAMPVTSAVEQPKAQPQVVEVAAVDTETAVNDDAVVETEAVEETDVVAEDPNIEAIQANGRLFVRNLPYTATEDELREHFAKYGTVEEVCRNLSLFTSYIPNPCFI